MGRIHVLSDNVANKIAAGEVVERPASVVKEMLENSLDAGSTQIRVDVESGGRRLIRIVDNGCGMLRDDALLAFERHATSKLSNVEELDAIATLGFRGEALPSIASVSRLVLETRSPEEPTGTRVEIAGGRILSCDELALGGGTSITVRDLFYNVPARKKFLRSDQTELAHIASLVTHYSLAHPEKSFELNSAGAHQLNKELLRVTPVLTDRERVFQVFGGELLEELIELEPRTLNEGRFKLTGFISRPQVQKTNRNSIFLFVNRRLIRDRLLLHAISAAYHNLMPPACYPFALLFIDCEPAEVDVNVHPSKTEVRFRNGSLVHDFVRDTLRETLVRQRPAPSAPAPELLGQRQASAAPEHWQDPPVTSTPQPGARLPYSEFTQALENFRFDEARPVLPESVLAVPQPSEPLGEYVLRPALAPPSNTRFEFSAPHEPDPALAPRRLKMPDSHGGFPEGVDLNAPQGMMSLEDLRVLGQIHDSFIIAAGRDGLWIIDQHVAHERILFEQVLAQQAAGAVEQQQLLLPLVVQLSPAQQVDYDRIADDLQRCGFDTEPFGNRTIAIKAAPAGLSAADLEKALFEILEIAEGEYRQVSVDDLRRSVAASVACRAAIKINMRLEPAKMEWLLRELSKTQCPMSCPHGRPVALRYSTREILRSFHRI